MLFAPQCREHSTQLKNKQINQGCSQCIIRGCISASKIASAVKPCSSRAMTYKLPLPPYRCSLPKLTSIQDQFIHQNLYLFMVFYSGTERKAVVFFFILFFLSDRDFNPILKKTLYTTFQVVFKSFSNQYYFWFCIYEPTWITKSRHLESGSSLKQGCRSAGRTLPHTI